MVVIAVFVALALVGQSLNVMIAMAVEQYSSRLSLIVFFILYMGVFWLAWRLAVRLVETWFSPAREERTRGSDGQIARV